MDDSICDLCDAHQLNQIDGFRIQKQIPERVPWYKDIRATTYPTDLHKSVITGIPNFAYTLQKNPPAYLISVRSSIAESQEHDYRNEMERSVSTWCSSSSEVSHTDGRCDIILQNKDVGLNTLLGEFKVWGRNDYKDVVNQLLKYFTSFQNTGFVFMINDNKSSIVDSYRPLILSAKGYVQDSIESNPIINSSIWPHFKSVHELNQSQKVTIYHFIFDTKHGIK
ncbi:MAG: hypothetical protein K2X47_03725 [Bdellovibrionales bacterium]|nr:hypothetical protein [Bdellovibrionales bacterium]